MEICLLQAIHKIIGGLNYTFVRVTVDCSLNVLRRCLTRNDKLSWHSQSLVAVPTCALCVRGAC